MTWEIHQGHALEVLREMPSESVQCAVTSPPYWGLRDYGHERQIGLEPTVHEYVANLVEVFAELRRVLRPDGIFWLNIGDCFATRPRGSDNGWDKSRLRNPARTQKAQSAALRKDGRTFPVPAKDVVGLPWRVAFALQDDGWRLRLDVIWAKTNGLPESVRDRPTKNHEFIFMFTKQRHYFFDLEAVKEPYAYGRDHHRNVIHPPESHMPGAPIHRGLRRGRTFPWEPDGNGRHPRSVWHMPVAQFKEAHFAVFPKELPRRCIKASTKPGDLVLDPFTGSGTTGIVALELGREFVGIELSGQYVDMARDRIHDEAGLLSVSQNVDKATSP